MTSNPSKKFENTPYVRRIEKPWGWEIHWVADNKPYMGKILHINAGMRLSLQKHDEKEESWWLLDGRAALIIENDSGDLEEIEMKRDVGYSCQVNQKHRLKGITDSDIVEVSTQEIGTTYRLEDDFKRQDETEEQRKLRNEGKA